MLSVWDGIGWDVLEVIYQTFVAIWILCNNFVLSAA
jgi:hypothetical protein